MGFTNCRYNTNKIANFLGVDKQTVEDAMAQAAVGGYARVWKIEDKGNYSVGQVSVSKKNKDTGNYDVEFQNNFVRFVGTAHTKIKNCDIPENGLSICISSCDVTSKWDKEKKKEYTNFVIFGFEIPDNNYGGNTSGGAAKKEPISTTEVSVDDEELPFN